MVILSATYSITIPHQCCCMMIRSSSSYDSRVVHHTTAELVIIWQQLPVDLGKSTLLILSNLIYNYASVGIKTLPYVTLPYVTLPYVTLPYVTLQLQFRLILISEINDNKFSNKYSPALCHVLTGLYYIITL